MYLRSAESLLANNLFCNIDVSIFTLAAYNFDKVLACFVLQKKCIFFLLNSAVKGILQWKKYKLSKLCYFPLCSSWGPFYHNAQVCLNVVWAISQLNAQAIRWKHISYLYFISWLSYITWLAGNPWGNSRGLMFCLVWLGIYQ